MTATTTKNVCLEGDAALIEYFGWHPNQSTYKFTAVEKGISRAEGAELRYNVEEPKYQKVQSFEICPTLRLLIILLSMFQW